MSMNQVLGAELYETAQVGGREVERSLVTQIYK